MLRIALCLTLALAARSQPESSRDRSRAASRLSDCIERAILKAPIATTALT